MRLTKTGTGRQRAIARGPGFSEMAQHCGNLPTALPRLPEVDSTHHVIQCIGHEEQLPRSVQSKCPRKPETCQRCGAPITGGTEETQPARDQWCWTHGRLRPAAVRR
eukprot:CAMPEP_0115170394 /NCGR_PEP_ID=MMETSP0270-20121206/1762_1 /TAXON_ID=71861 /ORGANISM="Scrippsiella trochoidea, Strain CCMP3099" /LENGTH=106 /DNA_ID=CAMNT_0002583123 /DNA_START=390 /DNA_END=710 /DNA_ORIENTATION=+